MKFVRKPRETVSFGNLAELFADIRIVCCDGDILWNRSLLAASSSFMKKILSAEDSFIILDSFSVKSVRSCLTALIRNEENTLPEIEETCESLLKLLALHIPAKDDIPLKVEIKTEANYPDLDEDEHYSDNDIFDDDQDITTERINKKRPRAAPRSKESINSQCFVKDPSPDRFVNGVKSDVFFLSPETALAGPPYTCLSCDYGSESKRNVKVHFRRKHSKEKLYRCKNCEKKFYNSSEVVSHWKLIHGLGNSDGFLKCVCDICGKMFSQPSKLKEHEQLHSGIEYPCKICGKTFKTPKYLKGHESLHMAEMVACKICGKTFTCQKGAEEHEQRIHSNTVATIPCDLCGKLLNSKKNLKHHVRLLHTQIIKKFSCDYCELCFRIPSQLKRHVETVHEKSTQFSCPFCGQILSSKIKFKRHSQRKHGGAELPVDFKSSLWKSHALEKVKTCPSSESNREENESLRS